MDEIGRGTSTRDGLAIAWAVSLSILSRIRARTLFATHFHELTAMTHEHMANYSMDVRDSGGEIVFLKRVRPGPSSNSYGIHVARLAGIPPETLSVAESMLATLDKADPVILGSVGAEAPANGKQPGLFPVEELVIRELSGLHPDQMTPLEALGLIARWRKELEAGSDG